MTSDEAATLKPGDRVKVIYKNKFTDSVERKFTPNSIMVVEYVKRQTAKTDESGHTGYIVVKLVGFNQEFHHSFIELFERAHK